MRLLLPFVLGLGSLATFFAVRQGQDFSKVEIKATHVAGPVHMLEGSGGNLGVSAGPDGVLLIDDQFAPLAPKIEEALKKLSDKPLRFLLNTHFHGDHTGGNAFFGARATIVAHENVRARLEKGNGRDPASPAAALPVVTYPDRISFHLNGEEIRVWHLPKGHTDGDSVVHFTKSNVVHMGDLYFAGRFPFIDLDGGGTVRGYLANMAAVANQIPEDAKVIPGHGPLSTVKDLREHVKALHECAALVEAGLKAGKTAEQMQSDKILDRFKDLGWNFISSDRFVATLARGLAAK